MNRPISTRTHGIIDAAWTTFARTAPKLMADAGRTARLVRSAGTAAGYNSMLTDYEAGALRLMPMKGHVAVDLFMCAILVMSPFFLPRAERRYVMVPVALGAVGLLTGLLTDTRSPGERAPFRPSRDLSEAVADPDFTHTPLARAHAE